MHSNDITSEMSVESEYNSVKGDPDVEGERFEDLYQKNEDLQNECDALKEEISKQEEVIVELEQELRDLKGNDISSSNSEDETSYLDIGTYEFLIDDILLHEELDFTEDEAGQHKMVPTLSLIVCCSIIDLRYEY